MRDTEEAQGMEEESREKGASRKRARKPGNEVKGEKKGVMEE